MKIYLEATSERKSVHIGANKYLFMHILDEREDNIFTIKGKVSNNNLTLEILSKGHKKSIHIIPRVKI